MIRSEAGPGAGTVSCFPRFLTQIPLHLFRVVHLPPLAVASVFAHMQVRDGVVLEAARRRKERRHPELVGRGRLVVLAVEVGGRWSSKTRSFLAKRAKAKYRQETLFFRSVRSTGGCVGQVFLLVSQRRLLQLHCS